jgi:cyclic AMP-dependent transcription factor ATF-2
MAGVNESFSAVNALPSHSQFALQTNFEQVSLDKTHKALNAAIHSSPAVFTASDAYTTACDPTTISPLGISFDADRAFLSSDSNYPFDGQMHYLDSSTLATFTDNVSSLAPKRRCDSMQSDLAAHSPTMPQAQVGRRRGSEYAEPGSVRAVYLEKNRKAASKCRGKQKMQQEELVETARNMERRNKILRVEVEILNGELQCLMQLLAQHTECPGARLKLYLQREADRITYRSQRNALPLPFSRSPYSGTSSISKLHHQKEQRKRR